MKVKTIAKVLALLGPLATFAPQNYGTGIRTLAKLTSYKFLSAENEETVRMFIKREKESATNLVEDISSPEERTENETSPLVVPSQTEIQPTIETEKDGLESIYTDAMQFNGESSMNSIIFILQLQEIPISLREFWQFGEWTQRKDKDFIENLRKAYQEKKPIDPKIMNQIYLGIKEQKISDLSLFIKIFESFKLTTEENFTSHSLVSKLSEYLNEPNKERGESAQSKAKFCGVVGFCLEILSLLFFSSQTNNSISGIPTNSTLNNIPALKAMWCLTWPLKSGQCLDLYIGHGIAGGLLLLSGGLYIGNFFCKIRKKTQINENDKKLFAQFVTLHALRNKKEYLEDSSCCNKLFSRICDSLSNCCNKMCCLICCKNKRRPVFPINCASLNPCEEIPIYGVMDEIAFEEDRKDQLEILENPRKYLPKYVCDKIGSCLRGCTRSCYNKLNCISNCWKKVSNLVFRKNKTHPSGDENENQMDSKANI